MVAVAMSWPRPEAMNPPAATTSQSASTATSTGFITNRPTAGSRTISPILRTSTGAGSEKTRKLEATESLDVRVGEGDMGRVIGKRGRIAQSIRTVVRAAAVKDDAAVDIEFVD